MKKVKKILAFIFAIVMVMAIGVTTFADVHPSDKGGAAVITVNNAQPQKTYTVYKVFSAKVSEDGKGITYGLAGNHTAAPTGFTLDATTKNITYTAGSDITTLTPADIANIQGYVTDNDIVAVVTTAESETSFKVTGLEDGYYYITTASGSVVSVTSTMPGVAVIDKSSVPGWDNGNGDEGGSNQGKVIVENGVKKAVNEAGLNEEISFNIGVRATNYNGAKKIYHYVIIDKLDSGMKYTSKPVVTIGGVAAPASGVTAPVITYFKGTNIVASFEEATSFRIDIPWTDTNTASGEHLYNDNVGIDVTYTTAFDFAKAAEGNIHYGNEANKNTAGFTWVDEGDDPDSPGSGKPKDPDVPTEDAYDPSEPPASPESFDIVGGKTYPDHNQPFRETATYKTELTISKVDGAKNVLTGAEFTLTSTNGTKTAVVMKNTFTKDASGEYWKLSDGTYTNVDPKDPSNTQKYLKTIETEIVGEGQTRTAIEAAVGDDGKLIFSGLGAGTYTLKETKVPGGYNKAEDITFTLSFDPATKKFVSDNNVVLVDDGTNTLNVQVENKKGILFPSTGGTGTRIFYILGAVLVLGAGIALVVKKKMQK